MNEVAATEATFENAYAAGPESATSHASLFSGQYPSEVGVVTDAPRPTLPDDIPLMLT